jgi:hypothetical protein
MEHGVEVVAVMAAGTGGGSGVRSDVLFALSGFEPLIKVEVKGGDLDS